MKLRITLPDKEPFEVEIPGEEVSVGRSPDCDVVLTNPYVSKTHLRLFRGIVAVDQGSINGTFLHDDEALEGAGLVPEARVRVGKDNVIVEVLDDEPEEGSQAELIQWKGKVAGLEHELEELKAQNEFLALELETLRKAEATRSAVQELSKAQLMKQGTDFEEFERLQQSYTEVLQRLQNEIDTKAKKPKSPF